MNTPWILGLHHLTRALLIALILPSMISVSLAVAPVSYKVSGVVTAVSPPLQSPCPPRGEERMEKALGIGGMFFRANDPAALSQWYQVHLGITPTPSSY